MNRKFKKKKKMVKWYKPLKGTSIGVVLLIGVIFLIFLVNSNLFNNAERLKEKYRGQAEGNIVNVKTEKYLSHSEVGIEIKILGYQIHYVYEVDGVKYGNSEFLNNNIKNNKKLGLIRKGEFEIRYLISDPNNSILLTLDK